MKGEMLIENKKKWSDLDLKKLEIAYHMGAPLEVMARIVGRSPSATNKTLTRYGIRPLGTHSRGIKPGGKGRHVTESQILSALKQVDLFLDKGGKENGQPRIRTSRVSFLAEMALEKELQKRHEHTLPHVTAIDNIIKYLKSLNIDAKIVQSQDKYLVKIKGHGHALSKSQLLVLANKKRIENKQPVFWLEEVTVF